MAISLKKGQKVDLTKSNPGLTKVIIGLGWDVNKYDGGKEFDLDTSAFMLSAQGKVADEKNFIYFNNPKSVEGSVSYSGDNKTGAGDGDDEQIKIDLAIVPANVEKISFGITIYEAQERNQNFGQVSNAYVRVVNEASGEELIRYDLGEDFSIETAVVVCDLYRNGSEWKFNAIGSGYQNGLSGLCKDFGLDV